MVKHCGVFNVFLGYQPCQYIKTTVSGTISVPIIRAMMLGTEMVPEMLVVFNKLAWLIAQENCYC
jgi:hypothetical protein